MVVKVDKQVNLKYFQIFQISVWILRVKCDFLQFIGFLFLQFQKLASLGDRLTCLVGLPALLYRNIH